MPVFNCESTLSDAIDSILTQTYMNWKLIICDDGSTDNTYDIVKKYKVSNPDKIILIKNDKNYGLNYSLNRCLEYVDTEFVARMDGDDISLATRFEQEIDFLDDHPEYAIVSTPMIYFDEDGDYRIGKGGKEPLRCDLPKGTPFCHATCLVRSEAYKIVKGYSVSKNRMRVEDWDLWIRMYEAGYKGYVLENALYKMRDDRNAYKRRKFKYRINEAKVSASATKKMKLPGKYYIWAVRPILVGLLPKFIYDKLHRRKR